VGTDVALFDETGDHTVHLEDVVGHRELLVERHAIKSAIARSGQSFTPRRSEGMAFFACRGAGRRFEAARDTRTGSADRRPNPSP